LQIRKGKDNYTAQDTITFFTNAEERTKKLANAATAAVYFKLSRAAASIPFVLVPNGADRTA